MVRAFCLALLLLALPAAAAPITLMRDVARFGWTAASGPVDHYEAVVNGAEVTALPPGQAFIDVARPYGAWFALAVRAVDAAGTRGPDSDLSEAYRLAPDWDADGDGLITPVDFARASNACAQFEGGLFGEVYLRRVCANGEVKATCP